MRLALRAGSTVGPRGDRVVVAWRGNTIETGFTSVADAFTAGLVDPAGELDQRVLESSGPPALIDEPDAATLRPPVGPDAKVLCVGHNYRAHLLELGHGLPRYPNVFSKFPESLVGAADDIQLDPIADAWDWEAELAFVVSRPAHRVSVDAAAGFIAGYTIANDVTARDWQHRATQWLLGKTFPATTPLGPWIVTSDEVDPAAGLSITCEVNGVEKQRSSTADLLFTPPALLSYLSQVLTLQPGDVVLTGTPGGVGAARDPVEWLRPGQILTTSIEGLGRLDNRCVVAPPIPTTAMNASRAAPSKTARPTESAS